MKKSKSVFLVFSQLVLPAVLFGQNIGHRNLLHFNLENNGVGTPAAILETASRGRTVIYETFTLDNRTVLKLGRATVEDDGVTWRVENGFLDAAKLSLKNDTDVTGGDVLRNPRVDEKEHYVIAYSTHQGQFKHKIHTGFSSEEFEVALTKKGYEANGLFPSLFEYIKVVYVTYVTSLCDMKIARAEADAEVEYEISLFVCMNPRFFHLDGDHFALVTSTDGEVSSLDSSTGFRSYFSIWRAAKNDGKISFSREWDWRPFDFGQGAAHFAFSHVDDRLTAIGWNQGERDGFTLLRKISFDPEFGLLKQDPLIDVIPAPSAVWDRKLELEKDHVEVVSLGHVVGAVFLKLNFTGLTSQAFIRFKQRSGDYLEEGLSVCMRRSSDNEGGLELFAQAEGGDSSNLVGNLTGNGFENTTAYLSSGREKTPIVNATLNVILDKSTVEIYGADGYLVITEPYRLTNGEPFSFVTIEAKNNVTLEGRISVLQDTPPPTTTPSPPTTKPSPPTTTASFATTTTTATPRKATTLEESSGSNVVMSMVLLGMQYITYV